MIKMGFMNSTEVARESPVASALFTDRSKILDPAANPGGNAGAVSSVMVWNVSWTGRATESASSSTVTPPLGESNREADSGVKVTMAAGVSPDSSDSPEKIPAWKRPAATAPAFATNEGGGTTRMPASTTTTSNAFGGFAFGTLDASDFAATLEILKTNTGSRILSNPTITTLDNKTASIIVGRQDPVPAYSFNSDTGAWEITGFTYEESGVELEVTPQINRDEFITLKVHPRVRENIGTATFPSGGSTAEIPIFTVREATTEVIVPNGHTLLIGGLISRTTVDFESKVPLLGDIPVLGYLFKKTTKREDAKELLIFLTPSIARASRAEAEARKLFLPRTLRELEKERSNKGEKEKKKRAKSKKRRARKS